MKNILQMLMLALGLVGLSTTKAFAQSARLKIKSADSLFQVGKYADASFFYGEAQRLFAKEKNSKEEVSAELGQLSCLYWSGKFEEAQQVSSSVSGKLVAYKLQSSVYQIRLLTLNGLVLQSVGKNDAAEKEFLSALQLNTSVKSEKEEATILNYLGVLNWNKGNNELALEHLNRSLSLRQKNGGAEEELAACYNDLGLVYSSTGKYDEAYATYQEAKKIYEKVYGTNHPKVGLASNNLAYIALRKGNYDEALSQYQNGLTIWKNLYGESHPNVAFVYSSIGQLHQERNENEEAIRFYDMAKEIYRKIYGDKHPEIASIYNQEALLYASDKEYKRAFESVQEALIANSFSFNDRNIDRNPAIQSYYKSNLLLSSLLIKAQVLETEYTTKSLKAKNLATALSTLRSCDSLIAKIRQLKTNKADKLELSSSSAQVYEVGIRICFLLSEVSLNKNYYREEAFRFSEKGKSAILQEAISDSEAKQFANIPEEMLKKEKSIMASIAQFEQKLADRKEPDKEAFYKEQLFALNRQYEEFVTQLEKQFPEYYALKYDVKSSDISTIKNALQDGEALVSFSISDSTHRLYVFYFDKKTFKAYDLPLSVNLFRDMKGLRNAIKFDDKAFFAKISYEMYKALFSFKIPSSIKNITIIPEGRLSTLPYEALLTKEIKGDQYEYKDAPFLIKRYGISIQYSATLYVATRSKKNSDASGVFLCAPVNFSGGINSLPGSQTEVDSIGRVMEKSGQQCFKFTFDKAKESEVKGTTFSKARLVHFATHGIVNEDKPELSQIYLSADTSGGQDGHLYSGEIYNLHVSADLVTLSACQTGLGKVAKGEGLIGLSRALLYAGAKNLIVSLWSVSDKSTSVLMTDFYQRYKPEQTAYRGTLRDSKLKLIQEGVYARPYYWAPFILVGN